MASPNTLKIRAFRDAVDKFLRNGRRWIILTTDAKGNKLKHQQPYVYNSSKPKQSGIIIDDKIIHTDNNGVYE